MLGYGFIDYNGERYYADPETGEVASNVTIVDGVPYFFGITKFKMMKGLFEYNGDFFYTNSEGVLQTGWQEIDGKYYYFDKDSYKGLTGWHDIDGLRYYFDPVNKERYQGIREVDGVNYFFGVTQGKLMLGYGFIDYNGERYYADPETGEVASNVTIVDGVPYFFGITKFKMMKGLFEYNGDFFYTNSEGVLQTGWQEIDGKYYYFDKDSYKGLTGWHDIDGLRYYFDPVNKERYQGIREVDGVNYFFGVTQGKLMLGYGFIDYNGERYYADPETGEVASNVTIVDGVPYFFGITKFKMMKGLFEYNGTFSIQIVKEYYKQAGKR